VREVLETYLKHISKSKTPGTVEIRLRSFTPFANFKPEGAKECYGDKPVESLTHMDVYDFLEDMERPRRPRRQKPQPGRKPVKWGEGSKRNCVQGLSAAFNWAARSGLILKNPRTGIEKPGAASRGAESLVGSNAQEIEENHRGALAAAPPSYRPFIQALKDTGASPGEIAAATAADFRPEMGAFVFHKESTRRREQFAHKTAKRKDRVIFLAGETLDRVRSLTEKYPTGPLFRRAGDRPFRKFHIAGVCTKTAAQGAAFGPAVVRPGRPPPAEGAAFPRGCPRGQGNELP
jgi:integrase